jgi:hypothetical protein
MFEKSTPPQTINNNNNNEIQLKLLAKSPCFEGIRFKDIVCFLIQILISQDGGIWHKHENRICKCSINLVAMLWSFFRILHTLLYLLAKLFGYLIVRPLTSGLVCLGNLGFYKKRIYIYICEFEPLVFDALDINFWLEWKLQYVGVEIIWLKQFMTQ